MDIAYVNRGFTYLRLGQFRGAIEDYNEAIRLDPEFSLSYFNRALAYTWIGSDVQAQQDVERAVELGSNRALLETQIEFVKERRRTPEPIATAVMPSPTPTQTPTATPTQTATDPPIPTPTFDVRRLDDFSYISTVSEITVAEGDLVRRATEYMRDSPITATPSDEWTATFSVIVSELEEIIDAWLALEPPEDLVERHDLERERLGVTLASFQAVLKGDFASAATHRERFEALRDAARAALRQRHPVGGRYSPATMAPPSAVSGSARTSRASPARRVCFTSAAKRP